MGFQDKSLPEIIILAVLVGLVIIFISEGPTPPQETPQNISVVKIASWNLQIFGIKKWNEQGTEIIRVIKPYDIIIIQEIRDETGKAWESLCNNLTEYNCYISSRAGRSTNKEQYGIIYKKWISLIDTIDFNSDPNNNLYWERPPLKTKMTAGNLTFIAYTIHTKPEDADIEIDNVYKYADYEKNISVIVLGDLNADCAYYDEKNKMSFTDWFWIIPDEADTTTKPTDCTYDRIIVNHEMYQYYLDYGIDTSFNSSLSDHYLVWAEFRI